MNERMATAQQPPKGILKNSKSFDRHKANEDKAEDRGMKWDEMNILATYHPADKDYGHMKITDPPTPYNYEHEPVEDESEDAELDPDNLASRLQGMKGKSSPRRTVTTDSESDEGEEEMTEDNKQKHKVFLQKRRAHYNEFEAVKLARKLIEQEKEEEDSTVKDTAPSVKPEVEIEVESLSGQEEGTDSEPKQDATEPAQ